MEQPEKLQQSAEKPYAGYAILAIGEGGGNMGSHDRPISEDFKSVADKIARGATYISLEKLEESTGMLTHVKGVDLPFAQLLERYIDRSKQDHETERNFVVGDANRLPLRENSIDEIWVENTFGDPVASFGWGSLENIARVLKPGGKLFVLETYTPDLALDLLDSIESLETELGLSADVYKGDAMIKKLPDLGASESKIEALTYSTEVRKKKPFLVIFTKTNNHNPRT
jgi:ubiquinone/menaquinone biosynthesis C-methylase UbiE